jgi:hypothetical protein
MEGFHFLLGLAQAEGRSKRLRDSFALNLSGKAEVGSMTRIVGLGAMTSRLATLAGSGGDGTTAEISKVGDLTK